MLDEASGEIRVQDGIYLFGKDWVQSVGARLNRLSPWGHPDFERTCRVFAVVQFGRRKDVRVGDECSGKSIESSGISASRIQRKVYPTNMGRANIPEAKKGYMIPYMVGKLASNLSHLTRRGLVKHVPGRDYFRTVLSQSWNKYVTSPLRPAPIRYPPHM